MAVNDSATTAEDTAVTIDVLANDTDADGAADLVPSSVELSNPVNGTATADATGTVRFTPNANFNGAGIFSYTVKDKSGAVSNSATVSVTVTSVNDAPTISDIADQVVGQDRATGAIAFTIGDVDNSAAALTLSATSSNAALVPVSGIVFSGSGANRTVQVTPASGRSGTSTIRVTVSDGSLSAADSFVLTVTSNRPPVANDATFNGTEDQTLTGAVSATDSDSPTLSYTVATAPAHGALTLDASGSFSYAPAANFNGADRFTFRAHDGNAYSNIGTVTLNLAAVNDAPTLAAIGAQSTDEDTATGAISVGIADVDNDPATLTVSAGADNTALLPSGSLRLGGSGANRTLTITPAANANGAATVTVTVSDGSLSASRAFQLTVNPVNDAPVANAADVTGNEDTTISGTLQASDVENDPLRFFKASDPAHGGVTVRTDGTFSYKPALNFAGTDSFTFRASDGQADSAPATVTLHVTDVPEPRLTVSNATVREGGGPLQFTVALSRAPDGPVTISYSTADVTARAGSDYTDTRGTLSFAPGGAVSLPVSVPVTDDSFEEFDETLNLNLAVASGADGVDASATPAAIGTITDNDNKGLLRIGAAKRSIQPTSAQIAGILEARVVDPRAGSPGAPQPITRKQFFNLGGFGVNPLQSLPDDPAGVVQQASGTLTKPAGKALFTNSQGREERTQVRAFVVEQPLAPACVQGQSVTVPSLASQRVPSSVTDCQGGIVVFLTIDAVGAGNVIQKGVKNAVIAKAATLGVTLNPDNILFGQTHTHAGADLQGLWGGVPQDWINNTLYVQAAEAVADALRSRLPARLSFRQGFTVEYNNYRRAHIDPDADADGTITLLQGAADDGTPIGNVLQYNAHPTGIGDGTNPRTPHSDFILGAVEWLESTATGPGGVALYYNGVIADASGAGSRPGCAPVGADQPYSGVRCKGEGIADHLMHAENVLAGHELNPTIESRSVEVLLPVTNPGFLAFGGTGSFNRYYDFAEVPVGSIPGLGGPLAEEAKQLPQLTPTAKTTVSRITLGGAGGLEIVTVPGEATNTFGQYIRGLTSTPVMFLGLTHNSFGYIVPEDEFNYVDQTGGTGLVVPYTNYLENVSLGPLTAPLLRNEGYNRLFGVDVTKGDTRDLPPSLRACVDDVAGSICVLRMIENRLDLAISQYFGSTLQQVATACHANMPAALQPACGVFDSLVATGAPSVVDAQLAPEVAKTAAMGCDFLDPSQCQYPFPNDFFTVAATPGSPQSKEKGGTGRRVNFNPLGMPRNAAGAGRPIDPTEWNRNDGFSPGNLIVTYVPGLKANADGSIPGAVGITDVSKSYDTDAPIFVIDADTGERQLVWAEIDLNANLLLTPAAAVVHRVGPDVKRPLNDGRAALIIRPAKNFEEGHRYIVALRKLKGADGKDLKPGLGFQACRGAVESSLRYVTPMRERCDHINDVVSTLKRYESGFNDKDLYLAWDFTVASAKNDVGRLAHMRDDAFNSLATIPGTDCTQHVDGARCASPGFSIDKVTQNPQTGIARRIEGSISVPSYMVTPEPTPGDDPAANTARRAMCDNAPAASQSGCNSLTDVVSIGQGASLPPARLFYNPADATPTDPTQAPFGDGLPDRTGTMSTRFMCQIPDKALTEGPSRAGIYGHGLLDSREAVHYDGVDKISGEYNFMFCAVDLYGFAAGDLVNVATQLGDVSNFPVIPDASQQGLLNYMFLARLIAHPQGFASNAAFQGAGGKPLFDRREVFYDGNSQGGIIGGAVLAISKDVNRGVLGSPGMNYSTLLQRSKDYDEYSPALYANYPDPLDRMFLFSMIQMLWDRSENDGYAEHLTRKSAVEGGPVDSVLLQPQFGDQQVTMWSADVMARTMDIAVDYRMVAHAGKRYPDVSPGYPQRATDYTTAEGSFRFASGASALVNWADVRTVVPPIGNVAPPHQNGERDPHDDPAKEKRAGRCQKAHFLHRQGRLLDVNTDFFKPEVDKSQSPFTADQCPAQRDNSGAPGSAPPPPPPLVDRVTAQITAGNYIGAVNTVLAAINDAVGDALAAVTHSAGNALGLTLSQTPPGAVDNPAPQPLMAGAARGPIRVPVGTPLGGYLRPAVGGEYTGDNAQGELTDNIPAQADDGTPLAPVPDELRKVHSPYATYSPPSRGYYDSLIAKAVALYDGHDYVVLVKTDFIGMLDEVVQAVADKVKVDTGIDLHDGLVMSATHTHDGPGAVANHSTRYFWLAMDAYQPEIFDRIVPQLAAVVEEALRKMQPARFGYAMGQEGDGSTTGGITLNSFRRDVGESSGDPRYGLFDNNCSDDGLCNHGLRRRIGVLRVDKLDGAPLALVMNYAAHGIAFDIDNQYYSGDVLASAEREVEATFPAPVNGGDPVVAMLVQNTGGNVSPRADGGPKLQRIERFGKLLAPQVRTIYDGIQNFDTQPDLRAVSQRIILDRKHLGYPDASGDYPYEYGAAQCNNDVGARGVGPDSIPGKPLSGIVPSKDPACIPGTVDANDLADNGVAENDAFLPQDTRVTAVKIGDAMLLAQPGEPLSEYGVRLLKAARTEGRDPNKTFIWGYSQDHVGYIMADEKADWDQGGTEGTTTFWGWLQGKRLREANVALIRALQTGSKPPADEFKIHYTTLPYAPAPATPSGQPGRAVTQPVNIERFQKTVFNWEGGDPVLDFPNVTLQVRNATGAFEAARRSNGQVIDSFFEMHLKYRLESAAHIWTVEFEAPKDWTAGTYRFAVSGKARQASTVSYALNSNAFQVKASPKLQIAAPRSRAGNSRCEAALTYTPVPTNYRLIDPRYDSKSSAPVRAGAVTFISGGNVLAANVPVSGTPGLFSFNIAGGCPAGTTASGRDSFDTPNTSGVSAGSIGADADEDGVADRNDYCPNTPAGQPTNSQGCSASQRDSDGDGLDDSADNCPSTANPDQKDTDKNGKGDACDGTNAVSGTATDAVSPPGVFVENASCAKNRNLIGGRSYQVKIPSASGETISFQVLEPETRVPNIYGITCTAGAHPLIMQGHGFGGARSTSGFDNFRLEGFTVISFDQRGHGDSTGTIRTLDPDVEGKDLVAILDWAEKNLDYLAYRDDTTGAVAARPAGGGSTPSANLNAGSIGGSYGGGFQTLTHAVDTKNRLHAMAPDITWHDLRWSLNPGDVLKSGWDLLLVAGGDAGSYVPGARNREDPTHRGLDPYMDEVLARGVVTGEFPREALEWFRYHSPTYWCGLNGEPTMNLGYNASAGAVDPNTLILGKSNVPGTNKRKGQPPVNVLFSQGMRDTLFNFNDAWANYQCFKARAGGKADVRLITHESGHILLGTAKGTPLDFGNTGGTSGNNCGTRNYGAAQLQWFQDKLLGAAPSSVLAGTEDSVCVSLKSNDAVDIPAGRVLAPIAGSVPAGYYAVNNLSARNIPEGAAAQALHMAGQDLPAVMPLLTVTDSKGLLLAGIPILDITVSSEQRMTDGACASGGVPTLRSTCDSILYAGLGKKAPGETAWTLIDDQVLPVRGLGAKTSLSMIGIGERLQQGEQLALLLFGYSPQYVVSYTRDASLPAVNITAGVRLPLYAAAAANGKPDFNTDPAKSVAPPAIPPQGNSSGLFDLFAQLSTDLNRLITAIASNNPQGAAAIAQETATNAASNAGKIPGSSQPLGDDPQDYAYRETSVNRSIEAVVITGDKIKAWSVPAAYGTPYPYPSGAGLTNQGGAGALKALDPVRDAAHIGEIRSAHNGVIVYPQAGAPMGKDVNRIAAWRYAPGSADADANGFVEIPVQVDQRYPYFLANARSTFSFYSGTDEELSYDWDVEKWGNPGVDPGTTALANSCNADFRDYQRGAAKHTPDPVSGLDDDDEIVFMYQDAGAPAASSVVPADATFDAAEGLQEVALDDPLNPGVRKFVYLGLKATGAAPKFAGQQTYVRYQRDRRANGAEYDADQWIDQSFFLGSDPQKLGSSNTIYGPNRIGTVCGNSADPKGDSSGPRPSVEKGFEPTGDRFPRDGVTVSTDTYQWRASGRWMVREVHVTKPGQSANYGADLIDRWKGRAFQQSPDSTVSVVGFEDEQVNWEANSTLLGERCGPVRCIRETWGADSGTNVTKTETFYRDAVASRYRVRVHPIPPDGLYTDWDYNRSAMVPTAAEQVAGVPGGRYYTALRPKGVPVDGVNDDVGQIDRTQPIAGQCMTKDGPKPASDYGGVCPVFFDSADPFFNLPLAFDNWEQVSAKGDLGSLVYVFEVKGATSLTNPLVVPYYRDDACLDDGTGDDPVQRPYPKTRSSDPSVKAAYLAAAQARGENYTTYEQLPCTAKQGAYAQHGVHYFFTHDSDNLFVEGKPLTEADAQWWQIMVPTPKPVNRGAEHANVVRTPVQAQVTPRSSTATTERGLLRVVTDFIASIPGSIYGLLAQNLQAALGGFNNLASGIVDLLIGNDHASVLGIAGDVVNSPEDAPADLADGANALLNGIIANGTGHARAGVGVVDMTPDLGYGAGQYAGVGPEAYGVDPYGTGKKQRMSYGVMSRATGRAIVIEGANGKRVALLKSDNYLAQDQLMRRVGQILEENGSSIGYDQILYGVTHAHSTTYTSTPSAGVWAFQDAFDPRQFEFQARRLAEAILAAERNLAPARMGATTVRHKIFKGQIMGPASADDGTPAAYPNEYGDHGLVVMRIETDEAQPRPIAAWINWGEHPEGLDGYDLHSADFVAFLERFVDRELGVPMVFSQGDVGSSEKSGDTSQRIRDDGTVCQGTNATPGGCPDGEGSWRDWNHAGYVQNERNVRFLADAVIKGWKVIGSELPVDASVTGVLPNNYVPEVQVAMSNNFPVDYRNAWVPGPLSHPYPSVSNCRSEPTANGNPGAPVLGLPDCSRSGFPGSNPVTSQAGLIYATLKAEGVPVPEHYDATAFGTVEENLRLKLQAVRLGDMVLGSCACEAQVDLILNFESRANNVAGDIYDGFDWACVAEDKGQAGFVPRDPKYAAACALQHQRYYDPTEYPTSVPGSNFTPAAIARMRAQVHNPANGWDAPEYVPYANAEPADPAKIKGNFTREELAPERGYRLAVGLGHAGDYNGYTVSYREYMDRDHYRKALTAYGSHTADYMVTRLVRMAGAMKGAGELQPEPHDTAAQVDEARQVAESRALGTATRDAYEAYYAALTPDAGTAATVTEPLDIGYFKAATFTWQGGSTATDNPKAIVEKQCSNVDTLDITHPGLAAACRVRGTGAWVSFADQTGEVQTRVTWPTADQVPLVHAGQFAWKWTANFEAYEAFPARLGSTPAGRYRFAVNGCINDGSVPQFNLMGRVTNFLADMLPSGSVGDRFVAGACRGGASSYTLTSGYFDVIPNAELVTAVSADASGNLGITIAPQSIPKSYASVFPYVKTTGDNGRFCKECSFRPWASSSATPVAVSVRVGNSTYAATGSGTSWTASIGLQPGQTAIMTASYTDGRTSRPYAYTRPGPVAQSGLDKFVAALSAFADAVKSGNPGNAGTALQNAANAGVALASETLTGTTGTATTLALGKDSGTGGVWLRGDLHVHDDHSSDGSGMRQTVGQGSPGNVSVADQITFAESQQLDFLPLTDHRTFDQHYDPLWKSSRLLLITGEEANSSPHATVFGAVDMINQGDTPAGSPELRSLQQSIWDAHAQGAAWSTAHPDDGEVETYPKGHLKEGDPVRDDRGAITPNERAFATGPDLAEIWNRGTLNTPKIAYIENRWNAGYRFGVAGASDNHFKELWPIAGPGTPMSHVLAADKSTPALLDGLHAGHTAINMGDRSPFVTLSGDFDGDGKFETVGGDERQLAPRKDAKLRVSVENGVGATVYVYRAPGPYAGAPAYRIFTPTLARQDFDFTITGGPAQDWYRVEVRGPGEPDALDYKKVLNCGDVTDRPDLPPKPAPPPPPRVEPSKCQLQSSVENADNPLRAVTSAIFVSTGAFAQPYSPQLPADAGQPDNAQLLFGDAADNAFAGFADVAVAGGVVHTVAEVRSGHKSHVLYRARLADGTLTQPFDLSPNSGLARQPAIAASGNDVWVAWQDERAGEWPHNPQVYLRHSVDGGANWDEKIQVSSSAARAQRPDLALINAATPVVVWEDNTGGAFDVLARIVGVDGVPANLSSRNKPINAGNGYDTRSAIYPASVSPKVAVRSDGAIAVAWQDNRKDVDAGWTGHDTTVASITSGKQPQAAGTQTDDWEIFAATRSATGNWSAPVNVSNSPTQADRHAALAFDADGVLHAAWDSKTNNSMAGPRLEIRESTSTDPGANWTAATPVTSAAQTTSQRPVFGHNGGDLSLLWTDGRSADWRWRVMRAAPDAQGRFVAQAPMLTGAGNGTWPSYDNGWLVFTSDRAATREQRKPQQVYLLPLDAPAAEIPAGAAARQFVADLNRFKEVKDETGATIVESTGEFPTGSTTIIGSTLAFNAISASGVAIPPARFDTRFQYRFLGVGCSELNPRVQIIWKLPNTDTDQPSPANLRGLHVNGPANGWTEFRYSANGDALGKGPPAGATAVSKIRLIMEAKVRDDERQTAFDCRMQMRDGRVYDGASLVYQRYAEIDRPDYADLCASYGIAGSEPVCGALRDAETQLRQQCEANRAPAGSCTLAGGNLHALIETCYANNTGESKLPACRVLDSVAGSAAAYCRQLSVASGEVAKPELCALIGGVLVSEGALRNYENSWAHRALVLQNRLGFGLELVHNTILHTHNSFNATGNNTPATASGSDYNQLYSIPDQLRMDIRAIEMDVHWMPGRDGTAATGGREPMLCHGLGASQFNAGCTTERPLKEGLREFRAWLDAHPDEVVMLYIEDDITGTQPTTDEKIAYDTTAQVVQDEIGARVYLPAAHGASCNNSADANGAKTWLALKRQTILRAGKQVLLMTERCPASSGNWNLLFHQMNGGNWQQGTQRSYANIAYPQCKPEPATGLITGNRGLRWTRVWEDSTVVTASGVESLPSLKDGGSYEPGHPESAITAPVTRELMRCGLNMPGFDRLYPTDGRLEAAVWSWDQGQPIASSALNCAAQNKAGRFVAADCAQPKPYACVSKTDADAWRISGNGRWADGAGVGACPSGYQFSVPANGYANEKLKEAKAAAGVVEVWLNYSDTLNEGVWSGDGGMR